MTDAAVWPLRPALTTARSEQLVAEIDALLPQTQCGKCGQPGCKPYANAIVAGQADINQCPPGGEDGIRDLAALLGREFKPLNPANGAEKPKELAFIDEDICIGCTLCIQACPVDAISGAAKQMHTVIAALCTGCELCVAPCPVDCISMVVAPQQDDTRELRRRAADEARKRFEFRNARLEREKQDKADRLKAKTAVVSLANADSNASPAADNADLKKALIAAALARAKAQRETIQARNTTALTPAQQAQIDEAERRRSQAPAAAAPITAEKDES